MATAKQLAWRKKFAAMAKAGKFAKNPAKRKVTRASQTTGEPPTKRLVKRRKKTATGPKGFFANPKQKRTIPYTASEASGKNKRYLVRDLTTGEDIAEFGTKKDAIEYAQFFADKWNHQVGVRSY